MRLKVKLDDGAYMPERVYDADAGFDLRTPIDVTIHAGSGRAIPTGVHIEIPFGYVGFLKSKSGLNVKKRNFVGRSHRQRVYWKYNHKTIQSRK